MNQNAEYFPGLELAGECAACVSDGRRPFCHAWRVSKIDGTRAPGRPMWAASTWTWLWFVGRCWIFDYALQTRQLLQRGFYTFKDLSIILPARRNWKPVYIKETDRKNLETQFRSANHFSINCDSNISWIIRVILAARLPTTTITTRKPVYNRQSGMTKTGRSLTSRHLHWI